MLSKALDCLFFFLGFKFFQWLWDLGPKAEAVSILEGRLDWVEDQLEMLREAVK